MKNISIIGALLMGFGTPAFIFGAVQWNLTSQLIYLLEGIAGLLFMVIGFTTILIDRKNQ